LPPPSLLYPQRRSAWSISTKVFLAFSAMLAVFTAVLSYGVYKLRQTQVEARLIHHCFVPLTLTLSEIHGDLTAYDAVLGERDGVILRKIVQAQRVLYPFSQQLNARVDRASEALSIIEQEPSSDASLLAWAALARQHLSDLRAGLNPLDQGMESLRSAVIADPAAPAVSDAQTSLRRQISHLQQLTFNLRRDARKQTDQAVRRVDAAERATTLGVALLSVLAAGLALAIMLIIHRTLRPIRQLTIATGEISQGQYSTKVAVQRMDEVGELAQSFNHMVDSIQARDQRLRLLQAYSENILNSVASGIIAVDAHTRITHINRAAQQLWGLDPAAAGGAPLPDVAPFSALPSLGDQLKDVLGSLRSVVTLPATALDAPGLANAPRRFFGHRDDRPRFNLLIVPLTAPLPASAGEPSVGALLIGEDVTEELFTRDELIKKERLAAIGRMTSQVTHELRNPLSAMNLNAELLQDELSALGAPPDGEAADLLRSIITEIDRLTSLTEEYLAYARLPVVRTEPTDLRALLHDLLRFLRPDAERRGVTLLDDLPPSLPLIQADANQLRRALLNLIRNAMEAMPDGGVVTVRAPALPAPDAERSVQVEIADSGPGIPQEDLAHIFSAFFSTKATGTGLGLPLTQQIIEEHGGSLLVASHLGQGTSFRVVLPR
jgi:signal transduction histidine kinase